MPSVETFSGFYNVTLNGGSVTIGPEYFVTSSTLDDGQDNNDGLVAAGGLIVWNGESAETYVGMTAYGPVTSANGTHFLYTNNDSVAASSTVPLDTSGIYYYCYYPGTLIQTPEGDVAVEDLQPGDLVCTADGRALPVRWMGRQTVRTMFADPLRSLPVRIEAGALGNGLPRRDLLVSPAHALGFELQLVNAGALVNGTSIRYEPRQALPTQFTWYHIELAEHALLLAEGTPAESFVDHAAPDHFDNHAERAALLGPDLPPIPEMTLPRAQSARQVPRSLRMRLAEIAATLGGSQPRAA